MTHQNILDRYLDYSESRLSQEELKEIELHLGQCADCAAAYSELNSLHNALKCVGSEEFSVSLGFSKQVQQQLANERAISWWRFAVKKRTVQCLLSFIVSMLLLWGLLFLLFYFCRNSGLDFRDVRSQQLNRLLGHILKSLEGALGALLMLAFFFAALLSAIRGFSHPRMFSYSSSFAGFAVSIFVVRGMLGLFFGSEFSDFEAESTQSGGDYSQGIFSSTIIEVPKNPPPGIYAIFQAPAPFSEVQENFSLPVQNRETYNLISEEGFVSAVSTPLSTFSADVDTASYSNVRRFLNANRLPPTDAVRIEEMINYFHYSYPKSSAGEAFTISTEVTEAPWKEGHRVVKIGIHAADLAPEKLPPSNLVFLIDVSGSMESADKLPLLKSAFGLLVEELRPQDTVSIVTYAGAAGVLLEPTSGEEKRRISQAIESLGAGGSTAGSAGIKTAYTLAKDGFLKDGNNRVILATDGDFNVGVSSDSELIHLIEQERENGIFLSVLGFGTGNYQEGKMEQLADKGNGNFAYIDSISEAKKVFVTDLTKTLYVVAKDVKFQVEFNPAQVKGYRLLGYENRALHKEDFNDDTKDAGEVGSGHTVTAIYEIIPAGSTESLPSVDPLKYQKASEEHQPTADFGDELLTVKIRYKEPQGSESRLLTRPVKNDVRPLSESSEDTRFACAVAEFGMLLRNSPNKGAASYEQVLQLGRGSKGEDEAGYRAEFLALVDKARLLGKF